MLSSIKQSITPAVALGVAPQVKVGLLNANFIYVQSKKTDIRKTFERVRAEMAAK